MLALSDIIQIVSALNEKGVRYLLIGGVAMRLHGCNHITDDLDVCYARDADNLNLLIEAFAGHHPRLRGVPDDIPFFWDTRMLKNTQNLTLKSDVGDVDFLGEVAGIETFEGLWERSVEMNIHGLPVRVASIEDLIAMKRAANRPKDQSHVLELLALQKLLQEEQNSSSDDRSDAV